MNFDPQHHNAAKGLNLVTVVSKNYPDQPSDYWLDPDGIHIHALWDITKSGTPDKRKKPQSLLRVAGTYEDGAPVYAGHFILVTPESVAKLKAANAEIEAAREALSVAQRRRDAAVAIGGER